FSEESAASRAREPEPFQISSDTKYMLLLGDPGAGKTTVMLTMVSRAVDRGNTHPSGSLPIPMYVSLSSWRTRVNNALFTWLRVFHRRPTDDPVQTKFGKWLVRQVSENYLVPERVVRYWIRAGDVELYLDGLDEITLGNCQASWRHFANFRFNSSGEQ